MNSIAAFMMVKAIDNERHASVERRRQSKSQRAGSAEVDANSWAASRGARSFDSQGSPPPRRRPEGDPHRSARATRPGRFRVRHAGYPRDVTRPTLTGTPDAVPTVELEDLLEGGDLEVIDRWLAQADVVEIADELSRLPREQRAVPFRLLPRDRALEVFELLDPSLQQELLEGLREANVRELFEDLDPDDRARLTEEMPAKVARRLLAGLSRTSGA